MIREKRNREKLKQYYGGFMQSGIVNPNVHPWVAESWQRCRDNNIPSKTLPLLDETKEKGQEPPKGMHKQAIEFTDGLYELFKDNLNSHNISMLLIDDEYRVLKAYALPFFERLGKTLDGALVSEQYLGTSSIVIAKEKGVPFLLFGPEMWIEECHNGDAFAAPIVVDGKIKYIISFYSVEQTDVPYDLFLSLILNLKYSLEQYLDVQSKLQATYTLLNKIPIAVYHVRKDSSLIYTNQRGLDRIGNHSKLDEVFLNYEHIPINEGFKGYPIIQQETTWITPTNSYEDVTTVLPLGEPGDVSAVISMTMAIAELKTTVAHAKNHNHRYSLMNLVGTNKSFLAVKQKAIRLAKGDNHVLLQGESGIGKQKIAYGMHQKSPRAACPFIVLKCPSSDEVLGDGLLISQEELLSKLELTNGGTLFIDEIERFGVEEGDVLADLIINGNRAGSSLDFRVIAACDSNLKKITAKGIFSKKLYYLLMKNILKLLPLRKRKDDIKVLAEHFLAETAERHNLSQKQISKEAIELLEAYSWPGNSRQLRGVLETAFFFTPEDTIEVNNIALPESRIQPKSWKHNKKIFMDMWKSSGGNITKMSKMADVSRVTMYRYLRKFGLLDENSVEN